MIRIYTRGGDQGMTGVVGGRIPKDSVRVEAYGTVDEANSFVGLAMAQLDRETFADLLRDLTRIQHELFDCGSDLAVLRQSPNDAEEKALPAEEVSERQKKRTRPYKVTSAMVEQLEPLIDKYLQEAPELRRFVLPGGSAAAAYLHVARVLTRRAERRVVTLANQEEINLEVRRYLNRLSDFFFAAARCANAREGIADVEYERSGDVFH